MTSENAQADEINLAGEAEGDQAAKKFASQLHVRSHSECPGDVIAFKFGGTSLLGAERMLHAAQIVRSSAQTSNVVVIVSAMKGVTDHLLAIGSALINGNMAAAREEAEGVISMHLGVLSDLQLEEDDDLRMRRAPEKHEDVHVRLFGGFATGVAAEKRHPRFKPGDSLAAEADQPDVRAIDPQRDQQRDWAIHELECRRHHTDHLVRLAIQHDAPAQNGAIASVARIPVAVRKNHHAFAARIVVGSGERASYRRLDAQDRKKAIRHRQGRRFLA